MLRVKRSDLYVAISHRTIYFFFFNDTATTEIYTLSLHDALPIFLLPGPDPDHPFQRLNKDLPVAHLAGDRKSTRLNSSHSQISYAVFCLKKKRHTRVAPWGMTISGFVFPSQPRHFCAWCGLKSGC